MVATPPVVAAAAAAAAAAAVEEEEEEEEADIAAATALCWWRRKLFILRGASPDMGVEEGEKVGGLRLNWLARAFWAALRCSIMV